MENISIPYYSPMQIFSAVRRGEKFFNLQLRSWREESEKNKTKKNKEKKREGNRGKKNRGRNFLGGALDPLEPIEASR